MSPFEALYERRCNTHVRWDNLVNRITLGIEMLKDIEKKVINIKKILNTTQDKEKSYVDRNWMHKEFKVEENVYLKLKLHKSSLKSRGYAKLAPRYCGPFKILERMGPIAYKLAFLANIKIHNVFNVSLLKKYVHDPNHVIDWNVIQVEPEVEFHPETLCILDREVTMLWN